MQPIDPLTQRRFVNIYGKADVGKTSTLNALINRLLITPGFRLIDPMSKDDISDRLIGELNGQKIGIITIGDPGQEAEVEDFLNNVCTHYTCDIIFAASRTFGRIYNMHRAFSSTNGFVFIETSPLFVADTMSLNLDFAPLHSVFADMLLKLI